MFLLKTNNNNNKKKQNNNNTHNKNNHHHMMKPSKSIKNLMDKLKRTDISKSSSSHKKSPSFSTITKELLSSNSTKKTLPHRKVTQLSDFNKHHFIGSPLQKGDNILFLSQSDVNSSSSSSSTGRTVLTLNAYNLSINRTFPLITIDVTDYNISTDNDCSVAIDHTKNLIYILSDIHIYKISMENDPKIHVLDTINSSNLWTNTPRNARNTATMSMVNGGLCVFGATSQSLITENKNKPHEFTPGISTYHGQIRYIPFDLVKAKKRYRELVITHHGHNSILQHVHCNDNEREQSYILCMGGFEPLSDHEYIPSHHIYKCQLSTSNYKEHEWMSRTIYLPQRMHSFGSCMFNIESDGIHYLLLFGGTIYDQQKQRESLSDCIYVLFMDDKFGNLTEGEIEKKLQSEKSKFINKVKTEEKKKQHHQQNLWHGHWFEINLFLPEKANYFVFYDKKVDKQSIHLITYNGVHYTLSTALLTHLLSRENILKWSKQNQCYEDGTCHKRNVWTEGGKNVIPTKMRGIKTRGPKSRRQRRLKSPTPPQLKIITPQTPQPSSLPKVQDKSSNTLSDSSSSSSSNDSSSSSSSSSSVHHNNGNQLQHKKRESDSE